MRMWMVEPTIMCRKHIIAEHCEIHMFLGHIKRKKGVSGFIKNNCLEPRSLYKRHAELVKEMKRRGWNHKSPLPRYDRIALLKYIPDTQRSHKIDKEKSLKDLIARCPECCENNRKSIREFIIGLKPISL